MLKASTRVSVNAEPELDAVSVHDKSPAPETVKEFVKLVRKHERLRSNVEYGDANHCFVANCCSIDVIPRNIRDKSGNLDTVPLLQPDRHNAFKLVDELQKYLARDAAHTTAVVSDATAEFKTLLQDRRRDGLLCRLGMKEADEVSIWEYEVLLNLMVRIFFPGKWRIKFEFMNWDEKEYGDSEAYYDWDSRGSKFSLVRLHPTRYARYPATPPAYRRFLNQRSMSRLSTLLHEVCHTYIQTYQCCPDPINEQLYKHGVAWQRVASFVEAAVLQTLELPLDLGRFDNVKYCWDDLQVWPTLDDVKSWKLIDHR